jgi:hypothetical protein
VRIIALRDGILSFLFYITIPIPFSLDKVCEEIYRLNSSHKTGSIGDGCSFHINMPNVLSTCNVGLFLNTLLHMQVSIFPNPCHGVNSMGL